MRVFVYGTLTDPDRAGAVVEQFEFVGEATLVGLHRVEGRYPTLVPGGVTEGRLLETSDIQAMDNYEGVSHGLYCRVQVQDGINVYVGDPAKLDVEEPISWPGNDAFESRVRRFIGEQNVHVRTTK
ncbi:MULTISPECIES: gamma-glutamylcyclotransferase family protein [unclassified Haladaptatus]|uniref:gamma-glutamylcyclotransferase family protein n=1 Tax=unclassified Haladaptatus TaxID=2622732 RepID=UPI00209BD100|nr:MULTISPECIES: gamma-glutamylcyclotransferase family protein [unclassified Haladaptatus]MCO8242508.1 gamma-glutamylcyclotransferase [Haladaptatus sp. AB643]MCO8252265.1 gamma-glutamylcyclotransferase [Haladaptatus sp. AB618]